jgi:hypothetical protein
MFERVVYLLNFSVSYTKHGGGGKIKRIKRSLRKSTNDTEWTDIIITWWIVLELKDILVFEMILREACFFFVGFFSI